MITIKQIPQAICTLHSPDGAAVGDEIGVIDNILSLNDIRIQIAQQKLEGYYFIFNGERIDIRPNGDVTKWPKGFYDEQQHQIFVLISIRRNEEYKYHFQ